MKGKGQGQGWIFLRNFWPIKRGHVTNLLFSLVEIYEKMQQNSSPLHLPLTLHLKAPTLFLANLVFFYVLSNNYTHKVQTEALILVRTDTALNLMKPTTFLPAPLGKWEVGYVDIMTEGPPEESSFIRFQLLIWKKDYIYNTWKNSVHISITFLGILFLTLKQNY